MTESVHPRFPKVLHEALDRMDQHRREMHSTLTTLVGPVGLAGRLWREWASATARATAIPEGAEPGQVAQVWVRRIVESPSLSERINLFLADKLNRSLAELNFINNAAVADRNLFFQQAGKTVPREVLQVVRCCLEFAPEQTWEARWQRLRPYLPELPGQSLPSLAPFPRFLPPDQLPTLLMYVPEQDSPVAVAGKLELGARLATQFPWLSVAAAVSPAGLERYVAAAPDSFLKGVVLESVLPVSGLNPDKVAAGLVSLQTNGIPPVPGLTERLRELGEQDLGELTQAAAAIQADHPQPGQSAAVQQQQSDAARSAAERLLFLMLENTPETAGLFELNLQPGFRFGSRQAELDLASLTLRIAIEVDGHYHFTDPDCYRRDRRKDILLQQNGFFILRFLAEDIFPRMEEIRATILSIVERRRGIS